VDKNSFPVVNTDHPKALGNIFLRQLEDGLSE